MYIIKNIPTLQFLGQIPTQADIKKEQSRARPSKGNPFLTDKWKGLRYHTKKDAQAALTEALKSDIQEMPQVELSVIFDLGICLYNIGHFAHRFPNETLWVIETIYSTTLGIEAIVKDLDDECVGELLSHIQNRVQSVKTKLKNTWYTPPVKKCYSRK